MSWEIVLLEPVDRWFLEPCKSDPASALLVEMAVDQLQSVGPTLGRPLVDSLEHSRLRNLKELRPGSRGRTEIRIIFVFDPEREAIFLVAGDKAGKWARWYDEAIPLAEERYREYREAKRKGRE